MEKSLSSEGALAVFDFDHTLIKGDSFWPFLTGVAGYARSLIALAEALALLAFGYLRNGRDVTLEDPRGFVKAHLMRRLLAGKRATELAPAIVKLRHRQTWNEPMRQALLDHAAQGAGIIIISGALDLYLPELVKDLPPHTLLCTRVGVKDGLIDGTMPDGNCVRARKAEILKDYLARRGPFSESWGYGNYPHDLPMLNLLKHRIIV